MRPACREGDFRKPDAKGTRAARQKLAILLKESASEAPPEAESGETG